MDPDGDPNDALAIPIDPALGGAQPDSLSPPVASQAPSEYRKPDPYDFQAPHGDPFDPEPVLFPIPEPPPPPPPQNVPKGQKRKRKAPPRENECPLCGGNENRNTTTGEPEVLLTCQDCSRSGHPTCLQLEIPPQNLEMVRASGWRCTECKICEICHLKGDDERILFCDSCDRGWHMDCLDPPIQEAPEGTWYCPACIPPSMDFYHPEQMPPAFTSQSPVVERELSVASSSRSQLPPTTAKKRTRRSTNGKASKVHDEPEDPESLEVEPVSTPARKPPILPKRNKFGMFISSAARSKKKKRASGKPNNAPAVVPSVSSSSSSSSSSSDSSTDTDEETTALTASAKSARKRVRQPGSAKKAVPKVKLRLGNGKGGVKVNGNSATPRKGNRKGKEKAIYSEEEEEEEEEEFGYSNNNNKGLFDDILGEEERDTSKTVIQPSDKARFERSRVIADEQLKPPEHSRGGLGTSSEPPDTPIPGPSRPLRSSGIFHTPSNLNLKLNPSVSMSTSPGPSTPGGNKGTNQPPPSLRINSIRFGPWEISTWYDAPFPEEYANIPDGRLWICEFCLKYMKSRFGAGRHRMKCKARHPPGDEIYRDREGGISVFEVDGRRNKIYCQNLCLLSKLYLDHKSLFYDVEPFLFYVLTEIDEVGARFIGYFSKEKRSLKDWNLSCIMTLPTRMRKGWGGWMMDFSYLLSKKEKRTGSPEKPLSALGALGYRQYWTLALMRYLDTAPENPRLEDISLATSMTPEDIYNTLVQNDMITVREKTPPVILTPGQSIKFPKGRKNGVARRYMSRSSTGRSLTNGHGDESPSVNGHGHGNGHDGLVHGYSTGITGGGAAGSGGENAPPFVAPTDYSIHWDSDKVRDYLEKWEKKGYLKVKPEKLKWSPFLLARNGSVNGSGDGEENGVMKTEAKGAVGVDELVSKKEKEREGEESGSREKEPEAQIGESDTPFSLFDDDDQVVSADDELPNLAEPCPAEEEEEEEEEEDTDRRFAQPETPTRSLRSRRASSTVSSLRRVALERRASTRKKDKDKDPEGETVETNGASPPRKRRRIVESPELEAGLESEPEPEPAVDIKMEDGNAPVSIDEDEDADGEYDIDDVDE